MSLTIFLINYLVITSLGVFVHFIHTIFKKGILVHVLGAINESTWEHLKLAVWPMLLSVVLRRVLNIGSISANYWFAGAVSILVSIVAIPVIYYCIRSVIKKEVVWISIMIYYIAVLLGLVAELIVIERNWGENISGIIMVLGIILAMAWFTYYPPKNFLFKDPISRKYGDIS